ncbi:MAG: [protein-PII] uridylyltransferase [Puniceicoccales bacterium]|jgi:[protein-PII] uridylyltransferase|nr:[protein-PII] uridylyltransferase [Puniceicoccales bacterium]
MSRKNTPSAATPASAPSANPSATNLSAAPPSTVAVAVAPEHPQLNRIRQHALARGVADAALPDVEWLSRARKFLRLERQLLLRNHRHGMSGVELARWRSAVLDVFLGFLLERALHGAGGAGQNAVALMAHGGYGRGELCPFSDIDLMLIYDDAAPSLETFRKRVTEAVLYPLWDLRLKPGHASRTIAETVAQTRADPVTRNTLLDARHIAGSAALSEALMRATDEAILADGAEGQVRYLLDAKARRHARSGGSVFVQEPNLKEGVGGLRDFHMLAWLARLHGARDGLGGLARLGFLTEAEARAASEAYSGQLRIRHELHFQSGRPEEVLSLEKQPAVAAALGCAGENWMRQIEDLMRHHYRLAETILQTVRGVEWRFAQKTAATAVTVAAAATPPLAEATCFDGFVLHAGHTLSAAHSDVFREDPSRLLRVFRHARQYRARPDFPLLRLVSENIALLTPKIAASPKSVDCFLAILADAGGVGETLAQMHESGVLCRFLPEFAGIRCLVQREIFHRYTVDAHTLLCLRELDAVFAAKTPPASRYRDALLDTDEPALLYLALLLHDIGKQHGVANHAAAGAEIAERVLRRFKIRKESRREVVALVRGHLDMAAFWRAHDLDDPENIAAFAAKVGSAQRLRYLYVLTYCDSRATAAELWNDYKHSLHTRLFRAALAILEDTRAARADADADVDADVAAADVADVAGGDCAALLREIRAQHLADEITDEEFAEHFAKFPLRYASHYSAADVALHWRMVFKLCFSIVNSPRSGGLTPVIHWREKAGGICVVTVATWDREGLFSKLAGAFAVAGLDILDARGIGHADHIVLDTFSVAPSRNASAARGGAATPAAKFAAAVEEALVGQCDHEPEIRRLARAEADALKPHERRLRAFVPPLAKVTPRPERHRVEVEIKAADRLGLLFFLARVFWRHRLGITFARIATEHGVARDTFYLESFTGEADKSPAGLLALQDELVGALA